MDGCWVGSVGCAEFEELSCSRRVGCAELPGALLPGTKAGADVLKAWVGAVLNC